MKGKSTKVSALVLILLLVVSSSGFAQGITKTIKVVLNSMTVKLDNKSTKIDTITYNNTVYVPLNKIADLNNKKTTINIKTNSIELNDKNIPTSTTIGYSRTLPVNLNTPLTIQLDNSLYKFRNKVTIKGIIRGEEAWNAIYAANQSNEEPRTGYEYILAKVSVEVLDGQNSYTPSFTDFALVSEKGKVYPNISVVEPKPDLEESSLYKGANTEGWITFLVEKSDLKPTIAYGREYDGSGGIWFKAYK